MVRAGRSDSTAGRKWVVRFLWIRLGLGRMGCCWWWVGAGGIPGGDDREEIGEMRAMSRKRGNKSVFGMVMLPLLLRVIVEFEDELDCPCAILFCILLR